LVERLSLNGWNHRGTEAKGDDGQPKAIRCAGKLAPSPKRKRGFRTGNPTGDELRSRGTRPRDPRLRFGLCVHLRREWKKSMHDSLSCAFPGQRMRNTWHVSS